MQGWVSIHRKLMNNPVWQDPKLLKLWMLCLLEASHKDHEQLVGKQAIKLQPGQFVTGRYSLSKAYNDGAKKSDVVPESTLWRWLKWLEQNNFVNIKTSTKYSVVTIVNWNQYQQSEQQMNNKKWGTDVLFEKTLPKSEQQNNSKIPYVPKDLDFANNKSEQQMNNKWTANEQQMNTNNNGNKGNKENKKDTTTTTENPIALFEETLCRLSTNQSHSLYKWVDDFGGNQEIINEAIRIADNKNKRYFGFVEYLLKEWANSKLDSLDRVKAFEQEKFNKYKKPNGAYNKKPIRTEILPDWFDEAENELHGKVKEMSAEEVEAKKRKIAERLKKFNQQEVEEQQKELAEILNEFRNN